MQPNTPHTSQNVPEYPELPLGRNPAPLSHARNDSGKGFTHRLLALFLFIVTVPVATFGIAWHGLIALRDPSFCLGMPSVGTQLLGTGVALLIAIAVGRRHWKWLIIYGGVCTLAMTSGVWYALDSGTLNSQLHLMTEVGPATKELRRALEAGHEQGRNATDLQELLDSGSLADPEVLDGQWYGPEAYSWESRYDADGRFTGTISIAEDPSRNVPAWTLHLGTSQPRFSAGPTREGLPMLPRPKKRSRDR